MREKEKEGKRNSSSANGHPHSQRKRERRERKLKASWSVGGMFKLVALARFEEFEHGWHTFTCATI
jgi:hypothetical protein